MTHTLQNDDALLQNVTKRYVFVTFSLQNVTFFKDRGHLIVTNNNRES